MSDESTLNLGGVEPEDVAEVATLSLASRLKAQVVREAMKTEEFPFVVGEEDGELTITIVAKRVKDITSLVQASKKSDSRFIIKATDHLIVEDGEDRLVKTWDQVAEMLELPADWTVDRAVLALVAGNDLVVGSVAAEILDWMRNEQQRAAARLGN